MDKQTNVAIIDVWLGPWPIWTQAWLLSCYHNPTINWLVFCEEPPPNAKDYPNVSFIPISNAEFENRASKILGFDCKIPRAHKICDYRPLYGLIFEEELKGFDFWGWGDNDIIWGDIRKFITEERLTKYDILTGLRCCIAGQFTIIRNTRKTNFLWQKVPEYKEKLLGSDKSANVCERGINEVLLPIEKSGDIKVWRRQLQTTDIYCEPWDKWALQVEAEDPSEDLSYRWSYGPCHWRKGQLFDTTSGEEFMFFHFQHWKGAFKTLPPVYCPLDTARIDIDTTGIWPVFEKNSIIRQAQTYLHQSPAFLKNPKLLRERLGLHRGRYRTNKAASDS
ncbi:DUF6625 family protein [Rubellicoccus peritrichatus]|uniref:DUF6625 family protein n=1 Tax=Rubellicoccus peritrichatus TaxID=3080537 RepID=A0AAQ3LAT0_9BACT|nr:DUF6625 family protein [Puniceicoccus sp. CR14]WOO40807.1 DUF6625 family protein [Puniceicoccus sp. CR14]